MIHATVASASFQATIGVLEPTVLELSFVADLLLASYTGDCSAKVVARRRRACPLKIVAADICCESLIKSRRSACDCAVSVQTSAAVVPYTVHLTTHTVSSSVFPFWTRSWLAPFTGAAISIVVTEV